MNQEFNLVGGIKILLKWKWSIVLITVSSGIIAVIYTLFVMEDYYQSTSVFYPTNQSITDRSSLFSKQAGDVRIDYFGTKHDANRLLQIAESSPLIDFMINHFKLVDHYEIDSTKMYWRTRVRKKFAKNYSVIKTERDAIEISILDTDPQLASDMVNLLVEKIDEHNKRPVINNKTRITRLLKEEVGHKTLQVAMLIDSLDFLAQKHGITASLTAEGMAIVNGPDVKSTENYRALLEQQQSALENLQELRTLYEQNAVSSKENVPSIFVLEIAYPADRKTKPVRSMICASTVLVTFFFSLIGAIMVEQLKYLREELARA